MSMSPRRAPDLVVIRRLVVVAPVAALQRLSDSGTVPVHCGSASAPSRRTAKVFLDPAPSRCAKGRPRRHPGAL